MNWTRHEWYMASDADYRIAKAGRIPLILKYIAYTPDKKMIDGSPFLSAREAIEACENHYETNPTTIPERDY